MWNDFSILQGEPQFGIDPARALVYGDRLTQGLLHHGGSATNKLRAVFRGHQQSSALNPMMRRLLASRGVFRHWQAEDKLAALTASAVELEKNLEHSAERSIPDGSVWTFNVAPDSVYGEGCNYRFDTFGILKTQKQFADWRLRVVNQTIGK
jgi:hypothetical protein